MYSCDSFFKGDNRDRENCGFFKFYNYLYCPYVRLDGLCSVSGYKVLEDCTCGRNIKFGKEKFNNV